MNSRICKLLGIEFPLVAFTHCKDVVVEVSKAGGMGVLGAVGMTPDELDETLGWIEERIEGNPYGVDVLIPGSMIGRDQELQAEQLLAMIPEEHKRFAAEILQEHGVDSDDVDDRARMERIGMSVNMRPEGAEKLIDVAFAHDTRLIANALGVPPEWMLKRGKEHGVVVAALVGAKEHAIRQVKAGVDVLVVSGTEGGGHCGSVSTMVLVPEVWEAIQPHGDVPILAAGGIVTGRQMAAAMAMGAEGAWTGSVWLTTTEAETAPAVQEKMLAASSSQTVRSRSRTGKHSRQLVSAWTEAWEQRGPEPLPMPLQSLVSEPALQKVAKLAEGGHEGARELATYWVGQGVGLMNVRRSVRDVVYEFQKDFVQASARLSGFLEEPEGSGAEA